MIMVFAFIFLLFSCWNIIFIALEDSALSSFRNETLNWKDFKMFEDQFFFQSLPMVGFGLTYLQVTPEIYDELNRKKPIKMHLTFFISTLITCIIYSTVGVFIFMTFGKNITKKFDVFASYLTATETSPAVAGVLLPSSFKGTRVQLHVSL
jgi:amino acid permease